MNYRILALIAVLSFLAGGYIGNKIAKSEQDNKQVTQVEKVQTRERVVTKILERPDGTKETVIVKDSSSIRDSKSDVKIEGSRYSLFVAGGTQYNRFETPIYTIGVDKKFILDLSIGAYVRSDKEIGLSLRYSF